MNFLIVSDSHGNTAGFSEILRRRRGRDDALLFLGDGCRDAEALAREYPELCLFCVSGNCDFSDFLSQSKREDELLLTFDGLKILMTHGHKFGVTSSSVSRASEYARKKGADILLFGHTHVKYEKYLPPENDRDKPLYVFNPGSISRPRDGSASFGTLEIKNGTPLFGHGVL